MLVCLLFAVLSYPVLRAYAARVERSAAEPVEKVHRLRRIVYAQLAVTFAVGVLAAVERVQEEHLWPGHDWMRPVGRIVGYAALFAAIVLGQLALRPAYQRLRGIDAARAKAARTPARTARSLVLALPMLVWAGVIVALPRLHAPWWTLPLAVVAMLLTVAVLSPVLLRLAVPTSSPEERVRQLVGELCDRAWVQLRDVRVLDTQSNPTANALFSGFGPGPKYVFLTDVLVEQLTDDQLRAVVAHEIGHLKGHHIAKRQGTLLAVFVLLFASVAGVGLAIDHGAPHALLVLVALVGVLALFLPFVVTGLVAIRQEKQADDYAADLLGPAALASALERLVELNIVKRRTGRVWNLLTKHPGFDQRIGRLRERTDGRTEGREQRPTPCDRSS